LEHESKRRILRNSAANLAVQVFQVMANLVVFLILARSLGKERLGEYYTLWASIMLLQLLLEGGVGTVLTRRLVQAPAAQRALIAEAANIFAVIVAASVLVFIALGAAGALARGQPLLLLRFAAAGVACAGLQVQRFGEAVLHAGEQFGPGNRARSVQGGLFVTLVAGLGVLGCADVETAMLAFAASQVAGAAYLLTSLRVRHGLAWRWQRPRLKDWLAESIPLAFGDMVRGPNWHLDTILLGLLRPAEAVGIYVVAYRPNAPLTCLPRAVLTATFPSLARLAATDPDALGRLFAGCLRWLWVMALPLVLALGWFAEPIIAVLVGPTYLEAATLLRLLIWKTALSFLSIPCRFLFTALGRQRTYGRLVLGVLGVEAILELSLIWWLGPLGAALGCVAGELLLVTACFHSCRDLGIRTIPWHALGGAGAAGAGMAACLWAGGMLPGGIALVVALAAYGLLSLVFGAVSGSELGRLPALVASAVGLRSPGGKKCYVRLGSHNAGLD
jgi:O-antigen/teichoic acid export membrane protein